MASAETLILSAIICVNDVSDAKDNAAVLNSGWTTGAIEIESFIFITLPNFDPLNEA